MKRGKARINTGKRTYSWLGFASDWLRRQQFSLIGYCAARDLWTEANVSVLHVVGATLIFQPIVAWLMCVFPRSAPIAWFFFGFLIGSFVISSFCDWLDLHTWQQLWIHLKVMRRVPTVPSCDHLSVQVRWWSVSSFLKQDFPSAR